MSEILPLRIPKDYMAAFLAFDRREVRIDLARADLRIGEAERDIFPA